MKDKTIKFLFCFLSFAFSTLFVFPQAEKKYIKDGNKIYEEGKYEEAEKNYQKALEKNAASLEGKFNKADALYRQKKFDEAAQHFNSIASGTTDKNLKAQAFHNLGNSYLQSQKLKESVDAYKNALRNNPKDEDTRKNLAYALKMMQQQQQQDQQKDKNEKNEKQENKDQQQNQQDQQKDQQKQDQQQQEKEQQQQPQDEQQAQQQKKDQLSKKDAQRLLEAMNNDERKLQEKLKKEKMQKVQPVEIEKDW